MAPIWEANDVRFCAPRSPDTEQLALGQARVEFLDPARSYVPYFWETGYGGNSMFSDRVRTPEFSVPVIDREALLTSFIEGGEKKCTLIVAPAGYGKSIFLAQLRERLISSGTYVASFCLDELEASIEQFVFRMACLWRDDAGGTAELRQVNALLESGSDRRVAEALCSLWRKGDEKIVVILDDFQKADSRRVGQLVALLVESLPPNIHLVVAARRLRQLPAARLRAKGLLCEMGTRDLRLQDIEAQELLSNLDGADLANSEVEGWPILVQLLSLARRAGESHPKAKDLLDRIAGDLDNFIETEILPDITEAAREMLLETAVVDKMEPELANALSGRLDCGFLLRDLSESSLCTVEASATSTTFVKERGLARFWLSRLRALRGEEGVFEQRRRAIAWLLERGHIREAAQQLAQLRDFEAVAKIIEDRGAVRIALVHGFPELTKLIALLPTDILCRYPRLMIARAWISAKAGNTQDARYWYERGAGGSGALAPSDQFRSEALFVDRMLWTVFEQHPTSPDEVREIEGQLSSAPIEDPWLTGWINNLLCIMYTRRGELGRAEVFAQQALESYRSAGSIYGEIFMHLHLALVGVICGKLHNAARAAEYSLDLAVQHFPEDLGLLGIVDFLRGRIAYEQYDVERARALLQRAMTRLDHAETWVEVYSLGTSALAKITAAAGDFDGAAAYLDITHAVGISRAMPRLIWSAECCRSELFMLTDQIDAAWESIRIADTVLQAGGREDCATWFERDRAALVRFRLALNDADAPRIFEEVKLFALEAHDQRRDATFIETQLLIAKYYFALGNVEDAAATFLDAVNLAAPQSVLRPFIEEGEAVTPIVKRLIRNVGISAIDGESLTFIMEILATLKPVPFGRSTASAVFTEKEMDVLSLLLENHSNKVIARRLQTSEATVKFHLIKIYRKLGVTTRSEAKAIAHERRLIRT